MVSVVGSRLRRSVGMYFPPSFGSEGLSEVRKLAHCDEAEVSLAAGSEMVDFKQRSWSMSAERMIVGSH